MERLYITAPGGGNEHYPGMNQSHCLVVAVAPTPSIACKGTCELAAPVAIVHAAAALLAGLVPSSIFLIRVDALLGTNAFLIGTSYWCSSQLVSWRSSVRVLLIPKQLGTPAIYSSFKKCP